jgi:hypothetical protein
MTVEALAALLRGKKIVCKTSEVEPAVPISNLYLPERISPGSKSKLVEPR